MRRQFTNHLRSKSERRYQHGIWYYHLLTKSTWNTISYSRRCSYLQFTTRVCPTARDKSFNFSEYSSLQMRWFERVRNSPMCILRWPLGLVITRTRRQSRIFTELMKFVDFIRQINTQLPNCHCVPRISHHHMIKTIAFLHKALLHHLKSEVSVNVYP